MDEQAYTDAQLADGTTLRFKGQLGADELRQKVTGYRRTQGAQDISAHPPGLPEAPYKTQKMDTVLTPHEFGERLRSGPNPGVSEGAGLREGLAGWTGEVGSDIGGGAKDIATGNFARGGHKLISGVGTALLPTLPFVGAAAPGLTARGLIGGTSGGYLAGRGARALGATPDQADLAGDVGGIAAGGLASGGLPGGVRTGAGKVLSFATKVDPDVVGMASPRLAHVQRVVGRLGAKLAGPEVAAAAPETAASSAIAPHSSDQVPGVPYAPRPRAYRASSTIAGPSRPGLMLSGEVASPSAGPAVATPPADIAPSGGPAATSGPEDLLQNIRERRGVNAPPDLPKYVGPERRGTPPAPEDLGFDFRPAEDIGNKTRAQVEKKMGPLKRGGATNPAAAISAPGASPDIAPSVNWPPEAPNSEFDLPKAPRGREAFEDKADQELIRDMANREDQQRFTYANRSRKAANSPARNKGDLIESAREMLPNSPARQVAAPSGPPPGTRIPGPNEDMTDLLNESLRTAKKKTQ